MYVPCEKISHGKKCICKLISVKRNTVGVLDMCAYHVTAVTPRDKLIAERVWLTAPCATRVG